MDASPRRRLGLKPEHWIPLAFLAFGALWVGFSDRLVFAATDNPAEAHAWSTAKGFLYVAGSAAVLYLVLRRAFARLEVSEALFRSIFEASPAALFIQLGDRVVLANREAARLTGHAQAALEGRPIGDLLAPEHLPAARARAEQVMRGEPYQRTARRQMRGAGGVTIPCEVELSPVRFRGAPAVLVTVRDLSAAEQAEQERQALTRSLQVLLDCDEHLVHAATEQELVDGICQTLVERGGLRMAWVMWQGDPAKGPTRPVASAGDPGGRFHAEMQRTWAQATPQAFEAVQALTRGVPWVVEDVASDPAVEPMREASRSHGIGSVANLPLVSGGAPLGLLVVAAAEPGFFRGRVLEAYRRLAGDVAFGIATHRTRGLLQAMMEHAPFSIYVSAPDGRLLHVNRAWERATGKTREETLAKPPTELFGEGTGVRQYLEATRRVVESGAPFRYGIEVPGEGGTRAYDVSKYPLTDAAGGVWAVASITLDVTEERLAARRLEATSAQLRALAARLQAVREEEMTRIARDLHDDLGQLLTGLSLDLRWIERQLADRPLAAGDGPLLDRAVAASDLAAQTLAVVQRIAADLRPGALDRLGLPAALRQRARLFQEQSGVPCLATVPPDDVVVGEPAATALYRIAQEALTNVARHAHATRAALTLTLQGGQAELRIEDDGQGLPPGATRGLGLLGMQERAAGLGGSVEVGAGPTGGTQVVVRLPLGDGEER